MTFQSLEAMNPLATLPLSNFETVEDYVSTGTDAAEYEQWRTLNNKLSEDLNDDAGHADDLADAGWVPTAD
jgi:hypothetical protein